MQKSVYLQDITVERLQEKAEKNNRSFSFELNKAAEEYLENHKDEV